MPDVQPPTTAPPGWYPDPSGAHAVRWWDGTAWTDHAASPPSSPSPASPSAPIAEVRPAWRWILYVAAVILGGSVLLMILGMVLWHNPRYRTVGRTTYFLSLASLSAVVLGFVLLAAFD
jgi:hypothetical protein